MCYRRGMAELDIAANRRAVKYGRGEMLRRVFWLFGSRVFRWTPRPCFGLRRGILRLFGAKIGREFHIYPSSVVYFPWFFEAGDYSAVGEGALIYNLGPVRLGSRTTVSHGAHLCAGTHDFEDPAMPLLKPAIRIGDQAWICADAFVGPGVTVGEGAVVGARAVAVKDVEPWAVVAGNPAKFLRKRMLRRSSGQTG